MKTIKFGRLINNMGSLAKSISLGELSNPTEDCLSLIQNITDAEVGSLIKTGSVILSDGQGNGFVILAKLQGQKFNQDDIKIIKLPYQPPMKK